MAVEIWALGCVMLQLFAEDNPFIEVSGMLTVS
jgi:hypothetical protein